MEDDASQEELSAYASARSAYLQRERERTTWQNAKDAQTAAAAKPPFSQSEVYKLQNEWDNKDDQAIRILSTFLEDNVARDLRNFTKEQYEDDECGYAKGGFTSYLLMKRIKAKYAKPTPLVYYKDFIELMKWRLHEKDDPLLKIAQLSELFERLQDFGLTFDDKFQALFLPLVSAVLMHQRVHFSLFLMHHRAKINSTLYLA
jgi:hypothetical protein